MSYLKSRKSNKKDFPFFANNNIIFNLTKNSMFNPVKENQSLKLFSNIYYVFCGHPLKLKKYEERH